MEPLVQRATGAVVRHQFNPPSLKFAKRAARRLQKACYLFTGVPLALSKAQEGLARIYGHADWFALTQNLDRPGYTPSAMDSELTVVEAVERTREMSDRLSLFLGDRPRRLPALLSAARVSDGGRGEESESVEVGRFEQTERTEPRAGLDAVMLHVAPFTAYDVPLPGWPNLMVIAAPLDQSALWIRLSTPGEVAKQAGELLRRLGVLSRATLRTAHVTRAVRKAYPGFDETIASLGMSVESGRQSILSARLGARLRRLGVASSHFGGLPPFEALAEVVNAIEGVVEFPDTKTSSGEYFEKFVNAGGVWGDILIKARSKLWDEGRVEPPVVAKAPRDATEETDGTSPDLGSALRTIPRGEPVYRLRIQLPLRDFESEQKVLIWREIEVPVRYSLWDLHVAIQDAMGWVDYHLHEFSIPQNAARTKVLTFSSPDEDDPDQPASVDADLSDHIEAMAAFKAGYLYDFGDRWRHEIFFVGAFPSDGGEYPRCRAGENACPPEDCGGSSGYFQKLAVLARGPRGGDGDYDEYGNLKQWISNHVNTRWPYRPDHFDPRAVRFQDPEARWLYAYG